MDAKGGGGTGEERGKELRGFEGLEGSEEAPASDGGAGDRSGIVGAASFSEESARREGPLKHAASVLPPIAEDPASRRKEEEKRAQGGVRMPAILKNAEQGSVHGASKEVAFSIEKNDSVELRNPIREGQIFSSSFDWLACRCGRKCAKEVGQCPLQARGLARRLVDGSSMSVSQLREPRDVEGYAVWTRRHVRAGAR